MISKIRINVVQIEEETYQPFCEVEINGVKEIMLIDTGASRTLFCIERLKGKIVNSNNPNLISNSLLGQSSMNEGIVDSFKIGDLEIKDYKTIFTNITVINENYKQYSIKEIVGILGMDILVKYSAIIRLSNNNKLDNIIQLNY